MKTRKPLKRSGSKRRQRADGPTAPREERPWAATLAASTLKPLSVPVSYAGGVSGAQVHKWSTVQCEEYRRLVAAMPCIHCGIHGYSQAAHPNTGKAGGKKLIDDRLCFPLCTVHPIGGEFVRGCHERFDQGALFTKEARRELEPAWSAQTRQAIRLAGQWPKRLPMWSEA